MRIRRLELVRYGRFTDSALDLPRAEPDLHIAVGPNEAGKSTLLSALEDLLFGIPARSSFNFLHDYGSMRLGATLESGGQRLEFRRRKGNRNTLLRSDDLPFAGGERALAPFLANADRGFFERMFSLDHERLRRGGREILDASGEVGQMLFSAGSGIQNLRGRLRALDEEADQLWSHRRSAKRKYYQAEDRLRAAESELRERTVSATKWLELKRDYEARSKDYDQLEQEIQGKSADLRKLSRIRRVARYVRRKSELDAAIENMGRVADIPDNARETLQKAEQDEKHATRRLEEQEAELEHSREERASLTWDESLLLRTADIARLHEQRIQVQAERSDLPKRERELAVEEGRIRDLASEFGWDTGDVEDLVARIPDHSKVAHARSLLNQGTKRSSAVESVHGALAESEARLTETERQLDETGIPAEVSKLAALISATIGESGDIGSRIHSAEYEAGEAEADVQRLFEDLSPRPDSAEVANSMKVPATGSVQRQRDARRELDRRLDTCKERIRSAQQDRIARRRVRDRIVADERPVRPEQVEELRAKRDLGWSLVRRRFIDGEAVPHEELHAFSGESNDLPSTYEDAVKTADRAADRRVDTAEAVARLTEADRSLESVEVTLAGLAEELGTLSQESAVMDDQWRELWAAAPFEPLGPDEMLRWLSVHAQLRSSIARRARAERQLAALRHQESEAVTLLSTELETLDVDTNTLRRKGLRVILDLAAEVRNKHQQIAEVRRKLEIELRRAADEVQKKHIAVAKAEAAKSVWQTQWSEALESLGLALDAKPDAVGGQIDVIDQMREVAARATDLRVSRIGKIRRDIVDFRNEVQRITRTVAPDLLGEDTEEVAIELERRLEKSRQTRREAQAKDKEIATREARIQKLREEKRDARETILGMLASAGVGDVAALRREIENAEEAKQCRSERAQVVHALIQEGDGLSPEELQAECARVDLDQAASREKVLEDEMGELRKRQMEARDRLREAREKFGAVGGSDAAAIAEGARQSALAEIQEVAEQYVQIRAASRLLQWVIDRNRREKQAPMLRKAGKLFADLTLRSFENLELDFDEQDQVRLVGRRPSGERVDVSGMSSGSVDQLYLALRVAALEDYLERVQPLPFVADDLFINFDDQRAAAGFRVLGQLAKRCQVIFLTHHEHLVELAQRAMPQPIPIWRL